MSEAVAVKKDRSKGQATSPSPEPKIRERGLVVAFAGRGAKGKTVECRFVVERALRAGRAVMPADGDRYNQTLLAYYPQAMVPPAADAEAMASWIPEVAAWSAENRWAVCLDLGGNDRDFLRHAEKIQTGGFVPLPPQDDNEDELAEWGLGDLSDLSSSANDVTLIYAVGDDVDDLKGLELLIRRGLVGNRTIIILNEGTLRRGPPIGAVDETGKPVDGPDPFAKMLNDPIMRQALSLGARTLRMPALDRDVAEWFDVNRISFGDALAGGCAEGEQPLNVLGRQRLQLWLRLQERRHKPFVELLP